VANQQGVELLFPNGIYKVTQSIRLMSLLFGAVAMKKPSLVFFTSACTKKDIPIIATTRMIGKPHLTA